MPNHQLMRNVWDRYVHKKELDSNQVPPHVANSWQRCEKLKIDPHKDQQLEISRAELERRLSSMKELLIVAMPTMENIYNFVRESGFQVVLADEQGYLLKVLGCKEILNKTKGVQLCPGANWTESYKGTNAIGTCLIERKPLQIHAWQHFCEANHFLTCSAAPIFDSEGTLQAVLNLTGDYHHANDHTLGMVVAGANAIENQLRLRRAHHKLFAAYKYSDTIINTMSEGLLTVDSEGIITQLNSAAGELIRIGNRDCIGEHVSKVLSHSTPILNLLRTGSDYENQKIVFEASGHTFYSSGRLLHDDFGNQIGAVAVFKRPNRSDKQPKKLVIPVATRYTLDDIIGDSDVMVETRRRATIAAKSNSTVMLRGESGTGKELFAQSIHAMSKRCQHPFVAINCAATPETLIESELFGYEEGAFTGACKGGRAGKLEIADGGTLFLDEIGDMPLYTQVKLLRVIQERKLSRLGSTTEIPVDIRIVAATHRDLQKEMDSGRFREDLYYRLNVIPLNIPALRDRVEDLPQLVEHFVTKLSLSLGKQRLRLTNHFVRACYAYPWPGNIRELENVIERAINMVGEDGALIPELMELNTDVHHADAGDETVTIRPLKEMEHQLLVKALESCNGNIVQASNALGISRNTIYRKIREYDIDV